MSPTRFALGAPLGGNSPKIRPFLSSEARLAAGRPAGELPTGRPAGVGGPATPVQEGRRTPALSEAVELALETLDRLERRGHEVANEFRWNHVREGNQGLGELVQSTHSLLRLAVVAARATGADLGTLCDVGGVRVDETTRQAVDRLIAQQFASDWVALADTLDDAFTPALAQWRFVFEALGTPPEDPGGRAA